MITLEEYFGPWIKHVDATNARKTSAGLLLNKINAMLLLEYPKQIPFNPTTSSIISGTKYGGFRPQYCPQGASTSSHKDGRGGDIYDPLNELDDWLSKFDTNGGKHNSMLEKYGLYREHPSKTDTWCHLTDRPPGSGNRTFMP